MSIHPKTANSSPPGIDADPNPPPTSEHFIKLPQCTLRYMKTGDGPPLIMVPATLSRLEDWYPLAQFMGLRFTAHFFELPGHGQSTAFDEPFTSQRVAETVESLMDELGFERASIMGFSFGGILTIKALFHLRARIDNVILISPAASWQALLYSKAQLRSMRMGAMLLRITALRKAILGLIQHKRLGPATIKAIQKFGNIEDSIPLEKILGQLPASTFEVLAYQLHEALTLEHPLPNPPFEQPCYFGMSVNDPLIDFTLTLEAVENLFENLMVERFDFPYHQPPVLPTFLELVRDYGPLLKMT